MEENKIFRLTCKYCGHQWEWKLSDGMFDSDVTIDDAIKYDLEVMCPECTVPSRLSEAMSDEDMEALGW